MRLHDHVDLELPKDVLLEVSDGLMVRQSWRMSFADEDENAILCQFGVVPVISRGRVRGALAVCREGEWEQRDEDHELLATIGRELGAAIDHRREFREALARASRESLLNSVAGVLDDTPDTRTAFRRAIRDVALWTGASEVAVVVRGADSRQHEILARHSAHDVSDQAIPDGLRHLLLSIPAMVVDRTEPLLIGPRGELLVPGEMSALGIGSLLVAPIIAHRDPIGVVVLIGDSEHQWGVPQREVAARLSLQLAARLEADEVVRLQARRISELSGLARIAEVVQSSVDPARLYRGFARSTAEVVPFARMYVVRCDVGDERLMVECYDQEGHATACPSAPEDASHPWLGVRTVTQMTLRDGKPPTFMTDVWSPIIVPMRPKTELIGAIVVEPTEQFEIEQLPLLAQAVSQLALALDSAELYRQATERAARIQVIGNLSRIVAQVVGLRDAFEAFAKEVRWLIPFDRAVMFRLDGAAGVVEPYAACPPEGFIPQTESDLVSSLAWRTYLEHKPVLIRRDDPGAMNGDWSAFEDAREVAMVPVLRGDECIAMLALAHGGDDRYTQSDIDALQEVGQLLAVSIERVELFQQAEHSARHDMLTGLPNARYLQEQMDALQLDDRCALLMLDMDNLKMFNDTLGHAVGDDAIRMVGEIVRGAVRGGDFVARLGGDEFVVLMPHAGTEGAQALAARIHERLSDADAHVENAPSDIRVSIGLATMPDDAATTDELLHAADVAMYAAKFAGGGRTALASGSMVHRLTRNYRRRPERLVDNIVQTATAAAAPREREAIALAQRYALATAGRMGLPAHESEVLRMLVAKQAMDRLKDPQPGLDQTLAFMILDGFAKDWAGRDTQAAALGHAVVEIALTLAWLQLPEPFGADLDLSEAAGRLSETRRDPLDATVLQEMQAALREQPTEGLRTRAA